MSFSVGYSLGAIANKKMNSPSRLNTESSAPKKLTFGGNKGKGSSSSSSASSPAKRKGDADRLREAAYSIQDPTLRAKLLEQAQRSEEEAAVTSDMKTLKKTAAKIKDPELKRQLMEAALALDAKPAVKPKRKPRKAV